MNSKICFSCSMDKPLDGFYKHPRMKDGYLNRCKDCCAKWATENRLKHLAVDPDYGKYGSLQRQHKFNFGGNREAVLERDGYKCVSCGMTQDEHQDRWNRSLTIDHIDGNGLHVAKEDKNNDMDNLQTLCLKCHGHKDVLRRTANPVKGVI